MLTQLQLNMVKEAIGNGHDWLSTFACMDRRADSMLGFDPYARVMVKVVNHDSKSFRTAGDRTQYRYPHRSDDARLLRRKPPATAVHVLTTFLILVGIVVGIETGVVWGSQCGFGSFNCVVRSLGLAGADAYYAQRFENHHAPQ